MIHYHGSPLGGTADNRSRFYTGRHALISYLRQEDLPIILECCQSFVLDNGAFTHWIKGKGEIDFDAYLEWVNGLSKHPGFDWALIPDKIDGDWQENQEKVLRWHKSGGAKGVPIYHLHEPLTYLEWLVKHYPIVALGSSGEWGRPNSAKWWERMKEVMDVATDKEGRPKAKLHGLRMLNPKVFTRLPLSSADSANAATNGGSIDRFGIYKPISKVQRQVIIADRIENNNSCSVWSNEND